MQIVIKIDEDTYNDLRFQKQYNPRFLSHYEKIILNGKPLPKGHGRLKDIDKIISDGRSKGFCDWYDEMKYAETIIEADKAESEG